MSSPPVPRNEALRLRTLRASGLLKMAPRASLDMLCQLAAEMLDVPIAMVSLVDEHHQWLRAKVGIDVCSTTRETAFCAHTICSDATLIVGDARLDPRFAANPYVVGAPDIRFYAGVPLTFETGVRLGTLCVIDRVPRTLTAEENDQLRRLAELVVADLQRAILEKRLAAQLVKTRRIAQTAREHMRRAEQAARLNALGWWAIDLVGGRVHWSREVRRIHGVGPRYNPTLDRAIGFYEASARDEVGAAVETALAQARPFAFEHRIVRADGVRRWVRAVGEPILKRGVVTGVSGAIQDISEAKEATLALQRLSLTDPMTGLSNRADFNTRLLAACAERRGGFALILMDVDRFKSINDTLGHHAGDAAIQAVARRLEVGLRQDDVLARLGGDEFAVIASGVTGLDTLAPMLDRLCAGSNEPWSYGGNTRALTLSLGAALCPAHAHDPLSLYKAADLALYAAKQGGRAGWSIYSSRNTVAIAA